jgi:hypothetical protein
LRRSTSTNLFLPKLTNWHCPAFADRSELSDQVR